MEVKLYSPAEVKELLSNMDTIKRFPMICYEKDESNVEEKTTRNLHLYEFEVATDAQGNGFSNTMLDYVFKYARQHECQYITLMAFDDDARSYWEHQGFTLSPHSTEQLKLLFKKL